MPFIFVIILVNLPAVSWCKQGGDAIKRANEAKRKAGIDPYTGKPRSDFEATTAYQPLDGEASANQPHGAKPGMPPIGETHVANSDGEVSSSTPVQIGVELQGDYVPECLPGSMPYHQERSIYSMEDRLCSCETQWTHHQNPLVPSHTLPRWKRNKEAVKDVEHCKGVISKRSHEVSEWLDTITRSLSWPYEESRMKSETNFSAACRFSSKDGEAALRESVQSRGSPQRLLQFHRKLGSCGAGGAVTIAVLGGSETAGHMCEGRHRVNNDFLGLPDDISLPVQRGNNRCPWANGFKAILGSAFPDCEWIDVYNLAAGATDQEWVSNSVESIPCHLFLAFLSVFHTLAFALKLLARLSGTSTSSSTNRTGLEDNIALATSLIWWSSNMA